MCEWDSLCCSDEEGLTTHHLPLSIQAGLCVCRLVGTSGHSSCLSVLPCPLTRVFTFDMCVGCWACRCVIMSGPRHAPPFSSSSSFEVLSMEGFIKWKSLLLSPCSGQYGNNTFLPTSSLKMHIWISLCV